MLRDPYVAVARSAALGQKNALAAALASIADDATVAITTLARHTLIGVTLATLTEEEVRASIHGALATELEAWRRRAWIPSDRFVRTFEIARDTLDRADVPTLLLKGMYFAHRLYGGLERRPQFDIDLLVPEARFGRARRALLATGFVESGYDAHSRTYQLHAVKLDLHRGLGRAPAYRLDECAWWDSAVEVAAGPLRVRTLSDEWTLVQVLVAAFDDIGQGTARLRQMADLYLLLRDVDAHLDWDAFFAARAGERLLAVTANVTALVVALFDAGDDCPRLVAALRAHGAVILDDSRRLARDLVFAPRKHAANLAWFAGIYPGSLASYLAWFWYGGFPANLRDFGVARFSSALTLALRAHTSGPGRQAGGRR